MIMQSSEKNNKIKKVENFIKRNEQWQKKRSVRLNNEKDRINEEITKKTPF
jgi:hypothetical protein